MRKLLAVAIVALLVGGAVPALGAFGSERASKADIDPFLAGALTSAAPNAELLILVRGESSGSAADAARRSGLEVKQRLESVPVAIATGTPAEISALATTRGVVRLEGDEPLRLQMDSSHRATRGEDVLSGFDAVRLEPQPDIPGETREECTNKRVRERYRLRNGRYAYRYRTVRTCTTVTTPPTPQPPKRVPVRTTPYDGSGVTVAVIDSGVNGAHPMFQTDGKSRVVRNFRYCQAQAASFACGQDTPEAKGLFLEVTERGNDSDSLSAGGHGTHVASTVAGGRVTTGEGSGAKEIHGAAPGAKLVAFSAAITPLHISTVAAAAALDWIIVNREAPCGEPSAECPPIRAVNNSYGPAGADYEPGDVMARLSDVATLNGITMVWAAGNGDEVTGGGDGSDNRVNPYSQSPVGGVLSVANFDDGGTATRDGSLATSSSRGNAGRRSTYPDISAPGTEILGACGMTLPVCRSHVHHPTDPEYDAISGTSMAAPHIAGIVAQLQQAAASAGRLLSPAEIEDVLEDTAYKFNFGAPYEPDLPTRNDGTTSFDKGHGLVDVKAATARVLDLILEGDAPAPAPANVCAGSAVMADGSGDAADDGTDVLATDATWADGRLTFTTKVADLVEQYAATTTGFSFLHYAKFGEREYFLQAARTLVGRQGPDEETFSVGRLEGNINRSYTSTGVTGSFDYDGDVVTISITNATLDALEAALPAEEGRPPIPDLADGLVIGPVRVGTYQQRSVAGTGSLVASDTAGSGCTFVLAGGSAPTPPATAQIEPEQTSPPAASSEAKLARGGIYEWTGGPFVGNPISGCDAEASDPSCDLTTIKLELDGGPATFRIEVTPDAPTWDFDVTVYDPHGRVFGTAGQTPLVGTLDDPYPTTTSMEVVEGVATIAGVYRVVVHAFNGVQMSYAGKASLA